MLRNVNNHTRLLRSVCFSSNLEATASEAAEELQNCVLRDESCLWVDFRRFLDLGNLKTSHQSFGHHCCFFWRVVNFPIEVFWSFLPWNSDLSDYFNHFGLPTTWAVHRNLFWLKQWQSEFFRWWSPFPLPIAIVEPEPPVPTWLQTLQLGPKDPMTLRRNLARSQRRLQIKCYWKQSRVKMPS